MQILDYLYYKIYRANLIGSARDIAEYATPLYIGILLFTNFFVLGDFLRKIDLLPFFLLNKKQAIIFMVFFLGVTNILYLYKRRYKKIISKYEVESEIQRKRGNLIVLLYVIISFLLIFVIGLYKPGKL